MFCCQRQINVLSPTLAEVLEFLLYLVRVKELGYSAVNAARSALSNIISIDGIPVGKNFYVTKFMNALFNEKPALPKTVFIWDTSVVMKLLKSWSPVAKLPLHKLTKKLLVLMLLISGQRGQTIHLLDVRNMDITFSYVSFTIGDLLKTSGPGRHAGQLYFKGYAPDRRLCVVTVLKEYLQRTLDSRGRHTSLFLTLTKPVKPASRDTIRRWTRETLSLAGINMAMFTPHSTRSASTSKAKSSNLSLKTILQTAGWFSDTTFAKYYNKEIKTMDDFANQILKDA